MVIGHRSTMKCPLEKCPEKVAQNTSKGAHASAAFYSLIETAKANNLEPYGYIKYILDNIAQADTLEKLEDLLPWNVPTDQATIKMAPLNGKTST